MDELESRGQRGGSPVLGAIYVVGVRQNLTCLSACLSAYFFFLLASIG